MEDSSGKKKKRKSVQEDHSKELKKKSKKDKKSTTVTATNRVAATQPEEAKTNDNSPRRAAKRPKTTTSDQHKDKTKSKSPPVPPAEPVRIATTTPSHDNPILVSFPGGLPQGLQGGTSDNKGPAFSWRKVSSLSQPHPTKSSSKRFRLVGKDETCVYQSEITVGSTTLNNDKDAKKDSTSSKSSSSKSASPAKSTAATPSATTTATRSNYSQWCVGLYDKRRQVLTLYPTAPEGQIFTLQQSVPTYQSITQEANGYASAMDRRRLLTQDFGSSKQKKAMQSQQDNLVNVDAVVGGARFLQQMLPPSNQSDDDDDDPNKTSMMSASNRRAMQEQRDRRANGDDTKMTDPAEEGYDQVRRQYLPVYNKNAKEAIKVYRAKDMLEDDEEAWSQIVRVVDACRKQDDVIAALTQPPAQRKKEDDDDEEEAEEKKPVKGAPWNASVLSALKRLSANNKNDDDDTERYQLQCAFLLNHLMNFYGRNANRKFIREPTEHRSYWWECFIPQALARRFVNAFTIVRDEEGANANAAPSYVMSPQKRDKCLLHILLLYMIVQGGRSMKVTNLQPLMQDLRVDVTVATKLLRMAGCTIVQAKQQTGDAKKNTAMTVQLQVPLTLPPPAQRKRRRQT